jgi:hypothetical protein
VTVRYPQVLVYETDGRLAALLRPLAEEHKWSLREPRRPDTALRLLGEGGPGVVVLRLSADRLAELALLDRITWLFPNAAAVVVLDGDAAGLSGLAWDLGASFVLGPGQDRDLLPDLVRGLMRPAEGPSKRSRQGDDAGTPGP